MPSPTMMTARGPAPRGRRPASRPGSAPRARSSTPMMAPTVSATSARSPVTMTMRSMPPLAQRADSPRGIWPHRVVEDQDPGRLAVDGDEHGQRPVQPRPAARGLHPPGGPAVRRSRTTQPCRPSPDGHPPRRGCPDLQPPPRAAAGSGRSPAAAPRSEPRRPERDRTPDPATPPAAGRRRPASRPAATIAATAGCPLVSVPVLSSSSVVHLASCSSTPPPLTTTPRRAATDIPETSATGAARISGHGVATTRTATARSAPAPPTRSRPLPGSPAGTTPRSGRPGARTAPAIPSASDTSRTIPA